MSTNTMSFARPKPCAHAQARRPVEEAGPRRLVLKPTHLRPQAGADLIEATRHFAKEGTVELAERMFDAAIAAFEPIQRMPAMGSPRPGQLCKIPGLRSWRVTGFPMQWLCFEAKNHLGVVRLLGDRAGHHRRPHRRDWKFARQGNAEESGEHEQARCVCTATSGFHRHSETSSRDAGRRQGHQAHSRTAGAAPRAQAGPAARTRPDRAGTADGHADTRDAGRHKLERTGRGLHNLPDAPNSEHRSMAERSVRAPKRVVCRQSALQVHAIGTQAPFEVWMDDLWRHAQRVRVANGMLPGIEAITP